MVRIIWNTSKCVHHSGNLVLLGKLEQLYIRNQFTIFRDKFVHIDGVPNKAISLQEVDRIFSNLGG